jgi:hypothetical protein
MILIELYSFTLSSFSSMSSVIMQLDQSNVVVTPESSVNGQIIEDALVQSYENKSVPKKSKWGIVKAANRRIVPFVSKSEIKLSNIIDELQKFAIAEQKNVPKNEQITVTNFWDFNRLFRQNLSHFLQKPSFHYIIISLVITDLIVVLIDLVLGMFRINKTF